MRIGKDVEYKGQGQDGRDSGMCEGVRNAVMRSWVGIKIFFVDLNQKGIFEFLFYLLLVSFLLRKII